MVQTVVPTLGSITLLKNPNDIIAYQLNYFASFPKGISSTFYEETQSLTDLISRYKDTKEVLCSQVSLALQSIYNRIFGDNTTLVTTTTEDRTDGSYSLVITILVVIDGVSYTLTDAVSVGADGLLKYTLNTGA